VQKDFTKCNVLIYDEKDNLLCNVKIWEHNVLGNYIVVQLLAMIPLIGFILMIIWAVGGSGTPIWKSNYARAYFAMMAIGIGISIIIMIAFGAIIASFIGGLGGLAYYY